MPRPIRIARTNRKSLNCQSFRLPKGPGTFPTPVSRNDMGCRKRLAYHVLRFRPVTGTASTGTAYFWKGKFYLYYGVRDKIEEIQKIFGISNGYLVSRLVVK